MWEIEKLIVFMCLLFFGWGFVNLCGFPYPTLKDVFEGFFWSQSFGARNDEQQIQFPMEHAEVFGTLHTCYRVGAYPSTAPCLFSVVMVSLNFPSKTVEKMTPNSPDKYPPGNHLWVDDFPFWKVGHDSSFPGVVRFCPDFGLNLGEEGAIQSTRELQAKNLRYSKFEVSTSKTGILYRCLTNRNDHILPPDVVGLVGWQPTSPTRWGLPTWQLAVLLRFVRCVKGRLVTNGDVGDVRFWHFFLVSDMEYHGYQGKMVIGFHGYQGLHKIGWSFVLGKKMLKCCDRWDTSTNHLNKRLRWFVFRKSDEVAPTWNWETLVLGKIQEMVQGCTLFVVSQIEEVITFFYVVFRWRWAHATFTKVRAATTLPHGLGIY